MGIVRSKYADHFTDVSKMVSIASGSERKVDDYMLTQYACCLIAQNSKGTGENLFFCHTMYSEPNEETVAAIRETRSGKYAGTIDTSSMEAFIKSCE